MSNLVDPSLVSDDDFDKNDETLVAANDMDSHVVSKFKRKTFFHTILSNFIFPSAFEWRTIINAKTYRWTQ